MKRVLRIVLLGPVFIICLPFVVVMGFLFDEPDGWRDFSDMWLDAIWNGL